MNATLLTQLETAETIPAGSLYMMEAGDGSGTKTVTQETLEQKMGQALKVGEMKELATEEKETLVGAINEAAQSGGGAAVDVLDTREEIEANTQSGKSAGALAVKEMVGAINSNFAYDANGIYGYRRKVDGADTVIPFKVGDFSGNYSLAAAYSSYTSSYMTIPTLGKNKIVFTSQKGSTYSNAAGPKLIIGDNVYTSSGTYDVSNVNSVTIKNDYINVSGAMASGIHGTYALID